MLYAIYNRYTTNNFKKKKRYTNNIVTKKNEKGGVNVQQLNTLLRDWEPFCTKSYLVL